MSRSSIQPCARRWRSCGSVTGEKCSMTLVTERPFTLRPGNCVNTVKVEQEILEALQELTGIHSAEHHRVAASEALGGMERCLDMASEYAKLCGRPSGSSGGSRAGRAPADLHPVRGQGRQRQPGLEPRTRHPHQQPSRRRSHQQHPRPRLRRRPGQQPPAASGPANASGAWCTATASV
jgi:hypothetical protein